EHHELAGLVGRDQYADAKFLQDRGKVTGMDAAQRRCVTGGRPRVRQRASKSFARSSGCRHLCLPTAPASADEALSVKAMAASTCKRSCKSCVPTTHNRVL